MTRQSTLRTEGSRESRLGRALVDRLRCHPRAYGGADGRSGHAALGVVRPAVLHGAAQRPVLLGVFGADP